VVLAAGAAAAVSLALATALGWLFWRLWSCTADDGDPPVSPGADGRPRGRLDPPYLWWLAGPR
jgi:hypothetical protein